MSPALLIWVTAAAFLAEGCLGPDGRTVSLFGPRTRVEREIDGIMVVLQPSNGTIDLDDDGWGDGVSLGVTLFSKRDHQAVVGDGSLRIYLYQGPEESLVKNWEFTPEVLLKNTVARGYGPRFDVGLKWRGLKLEGEGTLRVEFVPDMEDAQIVQTTRRIDLRAVQAPRPRPLI